MPKIFQDFIEKGFELVLVNGGGPILFLLYLMLLLLKIDPIIEK